MLSLHHLLQPSHPIIHTLCNAFKFIYQLLLHLHPNPTMHSSQYYLHPLNKHSTNSSIAILLVVCFFSVEEMVFLWLELCCLLSLMVYWWWVIIILLSGDYRRWLIVFYWRRSLEFHCLVFCGGLVSEFRCLIPFLWWLIIIYFWTYRWLLVFMDGGPLVRVFALLYHWNTIAVMISCYKLEPHYFSAIFYC